MRRSPRSRARGVGVNRSSTLRRRTIGLESCWTTSASTAATVVRVSTDGRTIAASLTRELLAPLGGRYWHTVGVAARSEELAEAVPPADRELLVIAAWWHDLGYAP